MEITLNGEIMNNDYARVYRYFGFHAVCPGDITQAVQDAPEGETLTFLVDSPGGDLLAGYEMFCAVRRAKGKTEAIVQSLAASAATVFLGGVQTVKVSPVAQIMIHLPRSVASGTAEDMEQARQMLDSNLESMLNAYELRCKGKIPRAELQALTEQETWLDPARAIEIGFADGYDREDVTAYAPGLVASVGQMLHAQHGGISAEAFAQMRTVYDAHLLNERTPEAETETARQQQLLAIEKIRYGGIR